MAAGKGEISQAQFRTFVQTLPEHGLSKEQMDLVFREFGPYGLKKRQFAEALQEFCKCASPIAITDNFDIGSSQTLRKLQTGETLEVIEGPKEDADTKVQRVRGRALRDGVEGWVSMKGNEGTPFLTLVQKPFLHMTAHAPLRSTLASNSAELRLLSTDEALELLEGPRQETPAAELLLQGSTCSDGVEGWITLKDSSGSTAASKSKDIFVCRSPIAMTDVFDIKACQVVRKIDRGEALLVIGGRAGKQDADVEITRLQFRALRDGTEGWVTLKGNQGTLFTEESSMHYVLDRETALRSGPDRASSVVRVLKQGETFAANGEPEEDNPPTSLVAQVRALEDGVAGWLSFSGQPLVQPWKPRYACLAQVELTTTLDATSPVLGSAKLGQTFEVADGPTVDKASGLRRVRLAADGAVVGWATIRSKDDSQFLRTVIGK